MEIHWTLILPIILLQLTLQILALFSLYKQKNMERNKKIIWALVVIFLNMLGPIIYFIFGRSDD